MRSFLFRLLPIGLILGVALVGFGIPRFESLTSHSVQVQKAHASGVQTPAGKWNLLVTFTSTGQQEPSTLQFNVNSYFPSVGSVTSYTPYSGSGFWYMTDSHHFTYEFLEKINDPNGKLIGYVLVQQSATLSADGITYDAHGQGIFIPLSGSSSPPNPTTTHAVKTN